jgi:hypothetical protein
LIEGSCAGLAVLKERGVIAVSSSNSIQLFGYTLGEAVTDPIVEAGE